MLCKPVLISGFLACLACAPAPALPPSAPSAATSECRIPNENDFPPERARIRNHTEFARQHYPERIREFARAPLDCGDFVMLGDSLTERHDWQELLGGSGIVRNRGIAGDTSDGVLARLGELNATKPRAVFLMIGTNDLWTSNSPRRVAVNVEQIIATLRAGNPDTVIYLQTVLPLRSEPALNRKVEQINTRLVNLAQSNNIRLIDTHALLRDSDGLLAAPFTDDGVHLTDAGYARWVAMLNQTISSDGL